MYFVVISRIHRPLRPASVFSMWCDVMWWLKPRRNPSSQRSVYAGDAVGAYMVNRYSAAGGQVPKVPLTVMQFARRKKQRMQKSWILCGSMCLYQSGVSGIFPWASDFFSTWASSGTIYYHLQKDANVNNPTNTFVRIDVWRFSDVLFIYFTIEKQLFQITT